jgi:hypothetical protein
MYIEFSMVALNGIHIQNDVVKVRRCEIVELIGLKVADRVDISWMFESVEHRRKLCGQSGCTDHSRLCRKREFC